MKQKELKNLAIKIAKYEAILDNPTSTFEEKNQAQKEIMSLSHHITSFEEIIVLDEMIQDILKK